MKTKDKYISIAIMILIVAIVGLYVWQETGKQYPASGVGKDITKRVIDMRADGDVIHYQEILFWSKKEQPRILTNKSGISSWQIREFKEKYNVDADNFSVSFKENLSVLSCDVHGKFMGSWYDFHWFLNPLNLDFLDNHFNKSERSLSWEGVVDGIKTNITLEFPFQINNCHAHVWPK